MKTLINPYAINITDILQNKKINFLQRDDKLH